MKKLALCILTLIVIASTQQMAAAAETMLTGKSQLTTRSEDSLVTLSVSGAPAQSLYYSINAIPYNVDDGYVNKTGDAISCTRIGSKAPYSFTCAYTFRADGTLIQ